MPLSGEDGALRVNWTELTVADAKGRRTYGNCWATDLDVDAGNAVALAACGRARWNIENGNNNVLKTRGYHLEHNFGHGEKHLANTLAALNILAFPAHTAAESLRMPSKSAPARFKRPRQAAIHAPKQQLPKDQPSDQTQN